MTEYTVEHLISDVQRIAAWGAELRAAGELGDASHAVTLSEAIITVASRIVVNEGRTDGS